jgi:cobalt-precorrin 5A hydrolase
VASPEPDHATGGDKIMTPSFAIGIGASSSAAAQDLLQLIRECIGTVEPGTLLATLDRRAEIASAAAASLGLRLVLFPASVLAQVQGVKTKSMRSSLTTGSWSIAEASALAALGPQARLILERQIGNRCTCAMAVLP